MCNGLRVYFTAAHIFNGQGQPLPILDVDVSEILEIGLLYFTVFGPDDLTTAIHTHGWVLTTKLKKEVTNILHKKGYTQMKSVYLQYRLGNYSVLLVFTINDH